MALFANFVKQEVSPNKFFLDQNNPNPFRSKTIIKYSVPYKTKVTIMINDSDGKIVEKLISRSQEAGIYEIEFYGDGISKGTYFYHMVADNYSESREMELIK